MSHYFVLPNDKKYHIVRYEPIIGSSFVHHGTLSTCSPQAAANVTKLPSKGPFSEADIPSLCQQVYMATAKVSGSPGQAFWEAPPDAGLPMGTADRQVVSVQLHYNNPQLLTGQKDPGSGIRLHYTSQLRQHDLGMLTMVQPVLKIPPGQASVTADAAVCPEKCTRRFSQAVTLVDGYFHMHGLGKAAIARRFRGGKELPLLDQLHSYDYDFQGPRPLGNQVLLPGDTLTLQCQFDSTSRTSVTNFGGATRDEMCFYWIMYYPAQADMGYCSSFGNYALALCDRGLMFDIVSTVQGSHGSADFVKLAMSLLKEGRVVPAPNPANTTFQPVCKQRPPPG
eukprot:gene4350-4603_t